MASVHSRVPPSALFSHRANLDPRCRLLFALILSIVVACLGNLRASFLALGIALLILAVARPPFMFFIKRFLPANLFIFFLWLVVPFTTPGPPAWRLGILTASQTGIELCLLATIKANALVIIFLAMIAPMSISSLCNAMRALHCPAKLAWLFLLMGRNVHLLSREWGNLHEAAKLRAFKPGNNKNTYRTLASLLALLLIRTHDRGQRMREAMLLRGFNGQLPPGAPLRCTWRDALAAIALACCLFVIIYVDVGANV